MLYILLYSSAFPQLFLKSLQYTVNNVSYLLACSTIFARAFTAYTIINYLFVSIGLENEIDVLAVSMCLSLLVSLRSSSNNTKLDLKLS